MKLSSVEIYRFTRLVQEMHKNPSKPSKNYNDALAGILRTVGEDGISFREALALCQMGFFMTHVNFDSNESMHSFGGDVFYEDGADLTASGLVNNPLDWMEEGWKIKACPHEVDYDMLGKMHLEARGLCLQGKSYEECIIKDRGGTYQ